MALHDIKVPLYTSEGEDKEHTLVVDEFAGRIVMTIYKGDEEIVTVECEFNDLHRAWNAVNRYP